MAIKTFTWDGRKSSDYGLFVLNSNTFDSPERAITATEIPTVNGAHLEDEGYFRDQVISYEVLITPASKIWYNGSVRYTEFRDVISSVRGFLFGKSSTYSNRDFVVDISRKKLVDDYDPRFYRMAYFAGPANWETMLNRYGKCTLNFVCDPRRYFNFDNNIETFTLGAGETITKTAPNYSSTQYPMLLFNESTYNFYPLINLNNYFSVSRTNSLSITGANNTLTLTPGTSSSIIGFTNIQIDTEKERMLRVSTGESLNKYLSLNNNAFPYCSRSYNNLRFVNNTTSSISITIEWRKFVY